MTRVAVVGAAIAGVLSGALLWLYAQRLEHEVGGGPRVDVLMATRDVALGARLTSDALATRAIPRQYVDQRHVLAGDARRILGVATRSRLRAGDSILWSDLATGGPASRDLANLVGPGMRAVAVPATLVSSFNGLLRPGDRVDALLTTDELGSSQRVTLLLLQNLLVLAVGESLEPRDDGDRRRGRRATVTLSATIEQAQALVFAMDRGEISLVLRNPEDVSMIDRLPEAKVGSILEPVQRARVQRTRPRPPPPEPTRGIERVD